jgi:hypothetical protein
MGKLRHRSLERWAKQTIDELQWFLDKTYDPITKQNRTNAQIVTDRANDDLDEATTSPSYDSDGRGGSDLTGPERHTEHCMITEKLEDGTVKAVRDRNGNPIMREDLIQKWINELAGSLRTSAQLAVAARETSGKLLTSHNERDRAAQSTVGANVRGVGAGHCQNCSTGVPGTRDDRLVSGRCPACLRYWLRHHRVEDRPRELWDTDDTAE